MTDEQPGVEVVEIVADPAHRVGGWLPTIGSEFQRFLRDVPPSSRDTIEAETTAVLSHCVPPAGPAGTGTGLVVGYVQSGKTLSFTGVSALARDNGYRLIVVLTGSSVNLNDQSADRLKEDLRFGSPGGCFRDFSSAADLRTAGERRRSVQAMRSALERWNAPGLSQSDKPTVFIVVMKNSSHLRWLVQTLSELDLLAVPALIIDDEADQAGLNTQTRRGRESTTYGLILQVRRLLPQHTYLQYTATPQALLLISIIDALSPEFTAVLTPGATYTGGRAFFGEDLSLIKTIPNNEIPSRNNVLFEPPATLLAALQLFFIGVAARIVTGAGPFNRSMMVHPSQQTASHQLFHEWVSRARQRYEQSLGEPETDPDREALVDEFRTAYDELSLTIDDMPEFPAIVSNLRRAVAETIVTEINTRETGTPQIRWDREQFNILVGGQALDRGYTVEGLTVTYMPRDQNVGNADNVQQRARWFGYKAEYLGYCRVYLSARMFTGYRDYVRHEEEVRRQLSEFSQSGRPLRELKRVFFLSAQFRPTRQNILSIDYHRERYGASWFKQTAPHHSDEATIRNRELVDQLRMSLTFQNAGGRTATQTHLLARGVPLFQLLSQFLIEFDMPSSIESLRFYGLLLVTRKYLEENVNAMATVYLMSQYHERRRRVKDDDTDTLQNLHQGPDSDRGRPDFYPGDEGIRDEMNLTVQIHNVRVTDRQTEPREIANVPALAIWLPGQMADSLIVQDQGY